MFKDSWSGYLASSVLRVLDLLGDVKIIFAFNNVSVYFFNAWRYMHV